MPRLILALDVPDESAAWRLIDRVGGRLDFVKIGLELFVAEGPAFVRAVRGRGLDVFLDLKLHDIPNTVARAVSRAAELDVQLLTVHASGGRAMLEAAEEARGGASLDLLGVTALTSLDAAALGEAWGRDDGVDVPSEVRRLARLAVADAGLQGVVCSPMEAAQLRADLGEAPLLVTPGIRGAGDDADDQRRVATPVAAAEAGATHLVLGRAVTGDPDPGAAFERIRSGLDAGARRGP